MRVVHSYTDQRRSYQGDNTMALSDMVTLWLTCDIVEWVLRETETQNKSANNLIFTGALTIVKKRKYYSCGWSHVKSRE